MEKDPQLVQLFPTSNWYQKLLNFLLRDRTGLNAEQISQLTLVTLCQAYRWRNYFPIANLLDKITNEFQRKDSRLNQKLFGCTFSNPIGLAAGFDKNGVGAAIWDCFGFGFAELGTVTWHRQIGNYRPRLFRLLTEQAALNKMGFNNDGAQAIKKNIENQYLDLNSPNSIVIGINVGKSKVTALSQAYNDYCSSLELLSPLMNYGVINISSPNTPGLRDLQDIHQLRALLIRLRQLSIKTPLLIKIAPDLTNESIDDIAHLAYDEGLAGIIAINTSVNRLGLEGRYLYETGQNLSEVSGGLSGAPLNERAIEVMKRLRKSANPGFPLIGVGGINSPQVAWERITAGASLIQIYTGWIYQGPELIPQILEGFQSQLDRYGLSKISDAVGSDIPWMEKCY